MAFELKEEGFKLKEVLLIVVIPEATYHYHNHRLRNDEKPDRKLIETTHELF
ncbi:hypothetical protein J2R98_001384 [Alkalibacillus filiformis]|uniref:Transposase n=1 Tax=Alkalibacillus filiformis TaxID=200990 RepID=A0ABU0DT23_9BACI|nr:hypothetical protein [Alkalibacillus filiformis]